MVLPLNIPLSTEKTALHPRNKHRGRYDFDQLMQANPALASFVKLNAYNDASIDFANPHAVKALNGALLKHFYNISEWDIPAQYLCPPIPGRADYLHHVADLLAADAAGVIPRGTSLRVLDIGAGAKILGGVAWKQSHHSYLNISNVGKRFNRQSLKRIETCADKYGQQHEHHLLAKKYGCPIEHLHRPPGAGTF